MNHIRCTICTKERKSKTQTIICTLRWNANLVLLWFFPTQSTFNSKIITTTLKEHKALFQNLQSKIKSETSLKKYLDFDFYHKSTRFSKSNLTNSNSNPNTKLICYLFELQKLHFYHKNQHFCDLRALHIPHSLNSMLFLNTQLQWICHKALIKKLCFFFKYN